MFVEFDRVHLVQPLGDFGDRMISGISSAAIASDEWKLLGTWVGGTVADIVLLRNINVRKDGEEAGWVYYCSVPVSNVKGYQLSLASAEAVLQKLEREQASDQAKTAAAKTTSND